MRRSNTTLSTMYAAGVRRGDIVAVDGRIFLVGRIMGDQPATVEVWRPTWWRRPVAWVLRFRRRTWRRLRNAWFDVLDALEGVDD